MHRQQIEVIIFHTDHAGRLTKTTKYSQLIAVPQCSRYNKKTNTNRALAAILQSQKAVALLDNILTLHTCILQMSKHRVFKTGLKVD